LTLKTSRNLPIEPKKRIMGSFSRLMDTRFASMMLVISLELQEYIWNPNQVKVFFTLETSA